MKKAVASLLVMLLLPALIFSGCGATIRSSGNVKTKDFTLDKFSRVEIGSAFNYEIVQSNTYKITITADDNLLDNIQVAKDGDILKIGMKNISILGPVTLKAAVAMPLLNGLNISGASAGTVSNFSSPQDAKIVVSGASSLALSKISAGDVTFEVSGASIVTGDLISKNSDFNISGASSVQVDGSSSDMVANASGASKARFDGFKVNNANINLSGASTGTVNLNGRLNAEITGASRLEYIGSPTMGDIKTSGASALSKK